MERSLYIFLLFKRLTNFIFLKTCLYKHVLHPSWQIQIPHLESQLIDSALLITTSNLITTHHSPVPSAPT